MKKGAHNQTLGDYVRTRRQSRGLDIKAAAERSGFHESYWRKLEAGHYDRPDPDNLRIIAETLSCPLEELYSLCGYGTMQVLPKLGPYLRATTDLSKDDIAAMQRIIDSLRGDEQDNDRRAA